ncbi:hypothetical protein B0H13DRAFT_1623453, partial [Mycena leptocephala]
QTETGSIVITPFSGVPTKPGSACATVPFFGHVPAILDPITGGGRWVWVWCLQLQWRPLSSSLPHPHPLRHRFYLSPFKLLLSRSETSLNQAAAII